MKTLYTTVILIAYAFTGYSQCTELVWADEFNGTSLDLTKWAFQNGNGCPELCGWGNGELQNYTSDAENLKVENGNLVITVVKENSNGSQFTSSKLRTLGLHSWTYGRFEARIKMPLGTGLWPAFWMLSDNNNWPMTGEIDIMEYRGDRPRETHGTLHYGSPWPNNQWDGNSYTHTESLADDFHVYAVEWEENEIRWYFDDVLFKRETKSPNSLNPQSTNDAWPWDENFYMILNLAVGGGFTGNPTVDQIQLTKPTLEVDYVRIYNGSASDQLVISGPSKIMTSEIANFSVPEIEGATYDWNTGTGIIMSSNNTPGMTLSWDEAQLAEISVTISGSACEAYNGVFTKTVEVINPDCFRIFNNFDDVEETSLAHSSGTYSKVNNLAPNTVNNSSTVLRYSRSPDAQYDVFFMDDALLLDGNYYENLEFGFEMDLYTTVPVGTRVELQIASTANWQDAWPTGRHTVYAATTSTSGSWETLQFALAQTGDPNRISFEESLDRMILLFNPNSFTNGIYFIDNIRQIPLSTSACTITSSDKKSEVEFKVYPLPANKILTIEAINKNMTAQAVIMDLNGKTVADNMIHGKGEFVVSDLNPGIYFLKISGESGISVRKIIIR